MENETELPGRSVIEKSNRIIAKCKALKAKSYDLFQKLHKLESKIDDMLDVVTPLKE